MSCAIENPAAAGIRAIQRHALEELTVTRRQGAGNLRANIGFTATFSSALFFLDFCQGLLSKTFVKVRRANAVESVAEFTTSLFY
jgi:hypothetical protein